MDAEQLEKIQLRCERLYLIAVLRQVLICKERHERLEIARREQERMEVERCKRERLEAERLEKERIVEERQLLFSQLEKDHLRKLKNLNLSIIMKSRVSMTSFHRLKTCCGKRNFAFPNCHFFSLWRNGTLMRIWMS